MENVGEGWLMTTLSPSPLIVALVQVANTLPMFVLALPAGSLADIFDRRKLLLISQNWMMVAAILLAFFTAMNLMTPWLLLTLTFVLGLGAALNAPAWRAIAPEIVSTKNLSKAIVLNGLGVNGSRIIGPALGGFIIAALGTSWIFFFNAISFIGVIIVLYSWKRKPTTSKLPTERLFQSIVKGLRYVQHSRVMRVTLVHALAFFPFSSAMFALMPLVARQHLGLGSGGYGIMLGFLGLGAVMGAIVLPGIQLRLTLHQTVMSGTLLMVILLMGLGLARNHLLAYGSMFVGGFGWIAVLSNLQTVVLTYVPGWVRSRVMSVYLLTFFAAQTFGSFMWGVISSYSSISTALVIASGGMLLASLFTWTKRLPSGKAIDFSPTIFWPAPNIIEEPKYDDGPVMVSIEYMIDPEQIEAFKAVMEKIRRARLREGAYSWYLVKDLKSPERQVEVFMLSSWLEHLRLKERATEFDRMLQQQANTFHTGDKPPEFKYFLSELG